MVEKDRDDLAEMLETLAAKEPESGDAEDVYHDLFYAARNLAEDLGYTKIEAQIRDWNFQAALDLLNNGELTH